MMFTRPPGAFRTQNSDLERSTDHNASELTMSKSWGGGMQGLSSVVQRHVSDVSNISYAGYLLKRSNRAYSTPVVSPFPVAMDTASTNIILSAPQTPVTDLKPVIGNMEMDFGRGVISSAAAETTTADWSLPKLPQHVVSRNATISAADMDASTSESTPLVPDLSVSKQNATVEESLEFAAAFFGIRLPAVVPKEFYDAAAAKTAEPPTVSARPKTLLGRTVSRSAPIKVGSSSQEQLQSSSNHPQGFAADDSSNRSFVYNRQSSLPPPMSRSISDADAGPPVDVIDPSDGHIWRAKYCVLEDGVLYFYRHQKDAETPQAHAERQEAEQQPQQSGAMTDAPATESSQSPYADLSKSPMPRTRLVRGISGESAISSSSTMDPDGPVWEKRVELDGVGAVRSTEMEFGQNAFELAAADDEACEDKLVLRARNSEEMNEWLFQFHRSIATFVMNIMDHVGSAPLSHLGDLHFPAASYHSSRPMASVESSPDRPTPIVNYSPRFQKVLTKATPSLSHGHGRNALPRKRTDGSVRAAASIDSPESPTISSPLTGRQSLSAPSSRTVTPIIPTLVREGLHPSPELYVPRRQQELDHSPELSAPQSDYPEMERPPPGQPAGSKYVPPHLRSQPADVSAKPSGAYVPPHLRNKYVPPHLRNQGSGASLEPRPQPPLSGMSAAMEPSTSSERWLGTSDSQSAAGESDEVEEETHDDSQFKRGGCADPSVVMGSVADEMFVARRASRLGKVRLDPFGCFGNNNVECDYTSTLRWEIGAVSECGIRESNEDAYLIASDLSMALDSAADEQADSTIWSEYTQHPTGLLAIFDGHCGDQAARYLAEHLPTYIRKESLQDESSDSGEEPGFGLDKVQNVLREAIFKLDKDFCDLCVKEGRAWESGATALVAMLSEEHLIVGNIGDARGIMGRSITDPQKVHEMEEAGWSALPVDDYKGDQGCLWKEVTDVHSPGKKEERARLEKAQGWITTETEIPIGQLQRMVLFDEDVINILKRCFADRYQPSPKASAPQRILHISRVCGELAVSRSIGDRDFKAAFNPAASGANCAEGSWDCPVMLPYPDKHSRCFVGDLVSNIPDFQALRVGEAGVSDEFLVLACDGLWDVMDADDAVRVTRDLLFQKQWPAKKAAARLAELAIHLGSSDNITVIVVRFFERSKKDSS